VITVTYQKVSSHEVAAAASYNSYDLDMPVGAGDVLGWFTDSKQPIVFTCPSGGLTMRRCYRKSFDSQTVDMSGPA